jgi:hypothetical protein
LAAQAACNFSHQVFGEAQVLERLLQDLGGILRLAAITLQTLLRSESTTLSGFGVAFLIGFGINHDVLLRVSSVP